MGRGPRRYTVEIQNFDEKPSGTIIDVVTYDDARQAIKSGFTTETVRDMMLDLLYQLWAVESGSVAMTRDRLKGPVYWITKHPS
jgi:hypothetical protein